MRDDIGFVELAPDESGPDAEPLPGRVRTPPPWLRRLARLPRPRPAAVAGLAVLLGLVVADTAASPLGGGGNCPPWVACSVRARVEPDLRASYDRLFPGMSLTSGQTWYQPDSGTVYVQELVATSASAVAITLTEQWLGTGTDVSSGPTVVVPPERRQSNAVRNPRHGTTPMTRHSVVVTERRGPWQVSAVLSGPRDTVLPLPGALGWVAAAPLPR